MKGLFSLFLYGLAAFLFLCLFGIIAVGIFGLETQEDTAIIFFFVVLLSYLCLIHRLNKSGEIADKKYRALAYASTKKSWSAFFIRFYLYTYVYLVRDIDEMKKESLNNNLALMNAAIALILLAGHSIYFFFTPFKPTNQAIFGWPSLIGFILLSSASYAGLKERIYRYSRKMKFWKKAFWTRQIHKSFYRVIIRLLPKIGLVLLTLGVSILIMNSCLEPSYQNGWMKNLYTGLIIGGTVTWAMVIFVLGMAYINSIREESLISGFMENGKTREEAKKEANDWLLDQPIDTRALYWSYNPFIGKGQ